MKQNVIDPEGVNMREKEHLSLRRRKSGNEELLGMKVDTRTKEVEI